MNKKLLLIFALANVMLSMSSCSKSDSPESDPIDYSIPASVDLGLSVNWSSFNYGALAPWEYGELYGWGAPAGLNINDSRYPTIDNIAETQYDIVHIKWGNGYRLPSVEELNELKDKCTWEYVTVHDVKGYKVTGPNGNSIFLPASGVQHSTTIDERGENTFMWSSNRFTANCGSALHIHKTYQFMSFTMVNDGLSVRGVTTQKVPGKEFDLTYGPIQPIQPEPEEIDPLQYTQTSSTTVAVTGFTTDKPLDVVIPMTKRLSTDGVAFNVTEIKASAFKGNKNLLSIEIPSSITHIEDGAFANCTNLSKVDYNAPKANEEDTKYWSNPVFENCENLTVLNIGGAVDEIPYYFFKAMNIEELNIPDNVEYLRSDCFASCMKLKSITIGQGVKSITASSFAFNNSEKVDISTTVYMNAISLETYEGHRGACSPNAMYMPFMNRTVGKIVFGSSVKSLCNGAFCETKPSVIESHNSTPPTLGTNCLQSVDKQNCKLYVPVGAKSKYQTAPVWKDFKNIFEGF